jgi:alkanesulfonate monooxygenase SsuD/methylene tetrahydromethanopterin reductase-like flavin-dependent oxidoreductase (luciferase family)
VLPNLEAGAARAGRRRDDLEVIVPCFTAIGDTDQEQDEWREMARLQVAFYGSTPNYGFIFEQLGLEGVTPRIRERQKAGDIEGMARVVTDDVLDHFVVTGSWDDIAARIVERYSGVADRVVSYFAGLSWMRDPTHLERWGQVARSVSKPG